MNERFLDLAETIPGWTSSDDGAYIGPHSSSLKLYAELIVRECANLFEIEYGTSEVSGNEVARVLKKHFGEQE
jgi:hypothetical protein